MSQGERRITKVSYDGSRVLVRYEREQEDLENDAVTVESTDAPTPAFKKAMQALVVDVVEVLEENMSTQGDKFTIRGVNFTWKKGNMGAMITALKESSRRKSPMVINTPIAFISPFADGEGMEHCLGDETVVRLQAVLKNAWKYVDGVREGLLFPGGETDEAPEAEVDNPQLEDGGDGGEEGGATDVKHDAATTRPRRGRRRETAAA